MTEKEARQIAEDFAASNCIDKCFFDSIRKIDRSDDPPASAEGDHWFVSFQFENDGSHSTEWTFVIVDDATGAPSFFGSL